MHIFLRYMAILGRNQGGFTLGSMTEETPKLSELINQEQKILDPINEST